MCGKFENTQNLAEILRYFSAKTKLNDLPCNQQHLPLKSCAIIVRDSLGLALWSWPMDGEAGRPLINIRIETAAQKPSFARDWNAGHRCLAPATAFYEKGQRFEVTGNKVFGLCGLWTRGGDGQTCFSVLTRAAMPPVSPIHDRMPVIVTPADASAWLMEGKLPEPPPLALKEALADSPMLL
ncbi:MAG: SOS response-associated peptidase family protein [Alphaproteobacteria bacterium]|nr:SOS response-associated peptidase family protein [Alphaproteobacteria bacterium]